jgi:2-methylaconitate cis-trans-isomerase PrpF
MRQLDGMGGGLSSLSKVCIISLSSRPDADVDYTFAQVLINTSHVDYSAICGNMTAVVGPFAIDEGIISCDKSMATVRIYNTNTNKIILAHFPMEDGFAAVDGDLEISGVSGTGASLQLEFLDPGGATTGKLLPTGNCTDILTISNGKKFEVSMVDASNACVFIKASDIGMSAAESPEEIERNSKLMELIGEIRSAASVAMGITKTKEEAVEKTTVPFIGIVNSPIPSKNLAGKTIKQDDIDVLARVISNRQPHRALPLGAALCMGVAAQIEGSVVNEMKRKNSSQSNLLRLGMPSGVLNVAALVKKSGDQWQAISGSFYRTQRRLFEGNVLIKGSNLD